MNKRSTALIISVLFIFSIIGSAQSGSEGVTNTGSTLAIGQTPTPAPTTAPHNGGSSGGGGGYYPTITPKPTVTPAPMTIVANESQAIGTTEFTTGTTDTPIPSATSSEPSENKKAYGFGSIMALLAILILAAVGIHRYNKKP